MNTIAAFWIILSLISAVIIMWNLTRDKQSMKIMNAVWILTGLWGGPLGLIIYFWFGRETGIKMKMGEKAEMQMRMETGIGMKTVPQMDMNMNMAMTPDNMTMPRRPMWQSITISTLHCGAGCTLADILGEWFLYFAAISIGGSLLLGSVVFDYFLALMIGIYFQYSAIRSMNKLPKKQILIKAIKADILSLTAWQIGMYGFMAIALFVLFPKGQLSKTSWLFWFMMQIAMLAGFIVAYPVNILLIKYGIKKTM